MNITFYIYIIYIYIYKLYMQRCKLKKVKRENVPVKRNTRSSMTLNIYFLDSINWALHILLGFNPRNGTFRRVKCYKRKTSQITKKYLLVKKQTKNNYRKKISDEEITHSIIHEYIRKRS